VLKPIRIVASVVLFWPFVCSAQNTSLASGHWEGTAATPGRSIKLVVDLSQNENGQSFGSMSFPDQKTSGMTLSGITIDGNSVAFKSPVTPEFKGTIAPDGQSMTGTIQLAANTRRVQLQRISKPDLGSVAHSSAITKQLEGTWEGALTYRKTWGDMTPPEGNTPQGATFGLRVQFSTGTEQLGRGQLSRLDEPGAVFPIDVVHQDGNAIRFEFFSVAGVFDGQLNGSEISGEWRQLGSDPIPVTFKRVSGS